MNRYLRAIFLVFAIATLECAADVSILTLGEKDYEDGENLFALYSTRVMSEYDAAQAGEVAPFGSGNIGADYGTPNFNANWTFVYEPGSVTAATLAMSLFESDTATAGNQVLSFTVNGSNLTSELNAVFESNPSPNMTVTLYSFQLPDDSLYLLDGGSVTFDLQLQNSNQTQWNGAGIDYSTLTLTHEVVPEPSTVALVVLGAAACMRKRRRLP